MSLPLNVALRIQDSLDEIEKVFKPGVKLTLLVRHPDFPDGRRDLVMTADDLDQVLEAIKRRKDEAPPTGGVGNG